jgi:HSP20 family molecular chaperone IbpA
MYRLFREAYGPEGPEEALTNTSFAPPVDTYEDEHNVTLKLEVPGIDEKDIHVHIDNNTLTVHGGATSRRKRTTAALSGSTEASPARSHCPGPWIRGK